MEMLHLPRETRHLHPGDALSHLETHITSRNTASPAEDPASPWGDWDASPKFGICDTAALRAELVNRSARKEYIYKERERDETKEKKTRGGVGQCPRNQLNKKKLNTLTSTDDTMLTLTGAMYNMLIQFHWLVE
jgi:hypothetical protein